MPEIPSINEPKKKLNVYDRLQVTYEQRLEAYKLHKFTARVKSMLELIPVVSKSVSHLVQEFTLGRFQTVGTGFSVKSKLEEALRHTVMVLMMDEFEILCWVNYIDQIDLLDLNCNLNDPASIIA